MIYKWLKEGNIGMVANSRCDIEHCYSSFFCNKAGRGRVPNQHEPPVFKMHTP